MIKRKALFILCILLAVITAILPVCATALAAERYQVMREGDKDEYVLSLQKKLYKLGYLTVEPRGITARRRWPPSRSSRRPRALRRTESPESQPRSDLRERLRSHPQHAHCIRRLGFPGSGHRFDHLFQQALSGADVRRSGRIRRKAPAGAVRRGISKDQAHRLFSGMPPWTRSSLSRKRRA
jgi:hypothetical protein